MDKDEEVFLDAEEEVTPRRSGRKRRSTAGSTPNQVKRHKSKMPTRHSPKGAAANAAGTSVSTPGGQPPVEPGKQVVDDQDFWKKMGGMFAGLETRMKRETDDVKEQLGVAVDTIGDLGSRVDRAEKRLDGLVEEVNLIMDKRLADLPVNSAARPGSHPECSPTYAAALASGAPCESGAGQVMKTISPERRKEDQYWRCRRALRLRPVGPGDVTSAVRSFMADHLGLSQEFLESVGKFEASRVPAGPSAKIKGEVIVTYRSTEVRDAVKGAARNLAGKGAEYGVRLELPNHLKSAMRSLQAVSYDLKTRFPNIRRNVLFDDDAMDLVLDFCLEEGKPWKRMTSVQARQRKRKVPAGDRLTVDDGELDRLLDGGSGAGNDSE